MWLSAAALVATLAAALVVRVVALVPHAVTPLALRHGNLENYQLTINLTIKVDHQSKTS
jgi:hypothetical protein